MAEVSGFENFLEVMAGADAFTLLLPFLLSWIVYYIALTKADFLFDGKEKLKRLPPVIALFLAFFTARFIVVNPWYQSFFSEFFGLITIGIVGLLGLYTVLSFSDYGDEVIRTPAMVLLLLMITGAAFVASGGFGEPFLTSVPYAEAIQAGINWTVQSGAIWLVFIGLVVWYVARPVDQDDNGSNVLEWLINAELNDEDNPGE